MWPPTALPQAVRRSSPSTCLHRPVDRLYLLAQQLVNPLDLVPACW
jgi:hypothetical protein